VPPAGKELSAAEFLCERTAARIFIRGSGVQGADFLMDGIQWELKTLESASDNAVGRNILKASLKQSPNVISDGRNVGMTEAQFYAGVARATRNGAEFEEVLGITGTGKIIYAYP